MKIRDKFVRWMDISSGEATQPFQSVYQSQCASALEKRQVLTFRDNPVWAAAFLVREPILKTESCFSRETYVGPVVQSIVSLTSSLRGQLSSYLLYNQILWNFCWKNERSFCTAKASHIFSSPGLSPGRAVVLPPALALALALALAKC